MPCPLTPTQRCSRCVYGRAVYQVITWLYHIRLDAPIIRYLDIHKVFMVKFFGSLGAPVQPYTRAESQPILMKFDVVMNNFNLMLCVNDGATRPHATCPRAPVSPGQRTRMPLRNRAKVATRYQHCPPCVQASSLLAARRVLILPLGIRCSLRYCNNLIISPVLGNTIEVIDPPMTSAPLESQDLKNSYLAWMGTKMTVDWNNDYPSYFLPVYKDMYGNFDIILDHFPQIREPYATPHVPCDMLYFPRIQLGADWCFKLDALTNPRLQV